MRRNSNKKNNIISMFLVGLLVITVGYALISTQLNINGGVNLKGNKWDVHFENVQIKEGSIVADLAPTSNNTTTTEIPYTITLTEPGEFYEFTVDIVNKGTLDAMIDDVAIDLYASDGTTKISIPNYLKTKVTYADESEIQKKHLLKVNEFETIGIRVEFREDIENSDLPSDSDKSFRFIATLSYTQADDSAVERPKVIGCPNCVFLYTLNGLEYGPNGTILNENQYNKDYKKVIERSGKSYFFGAILDNKRIDRAFVCKATDRKVFCLEGALNNESGGNAAKRNQVIASNNSIATNEISSEYPCYEISQDSYQCYDGDVPNVMFDPYVNVSINESDGSEDRCYLTEYTEMICYEGE